MTKSYREEPFFKEFEKKGKELYGNSYELQEKDEQILQMLKAYFGKDKEAAENLGISLSKGILLSGPIGVGKTSIMYIFRACLLNEYRFLIKPCSEVSFEFLQEGAGVIFQYSRNSFKENRTPRTVCFDDLGLEPQTSFFGNKANVMREVILARYYYFQSQNMITHITTNMGAADIEKRYGKEVRSRLREMCNFISFPKESEDKRR